MRYEDAERRPPRTTDDVRAQLRALPPGVLYELAAARSAEDDGDWRARGAALLLQAAADDQVSAGARR